MLFVLVVIRASKAVILDVFDPTFVVKVEML